MTRAWTILVCRTCDRLAQWPFCEHKPNGLVLPEAQHWTENVVVRTRAKKRPPEGRA